jgi:hypothetical protein
LKDLLVSHYEVDLRVERVLIIECVLLLLRVLPLSSSVFSPSVGASGTFGAAITVVVG